MEKEEELDEEFESHLLFVLDAAQALHKLLY